MLVVGLTGGIGCGKSAVSSRFEALGIPVIDADLVAREIVAPGQPALQQIEAHFGSEVISADGSLNRSRLRTIVFDDPEARKALESLLHPQIRRTMRERLKVLESRYAILSIPLLVETGQWKDVDLVLVVDCSESIQLERVTKRDNVTVDQARAILAAQIPREKRLQRADDIIDNSGNLAELQTQIEKLHSKYLKLSSQR